MKFLDLINENKNKKINIYCDVDGVLAEYDIGNFDYETIRPLTSVIKKIEKLYSEDNINIKLLSICKTNRVVEDKKIWLNKNLPFMSEEDFILISKENIKEISSDDLKYNYLKDRINDDINIVIDDDIRIIKKLKGLENLIIFHISSLVD